MSSLLSGQTAIWAVILMVLVPILIIGANELQERLRQRDSPFGSVVRVVRDWAIPLFAAWAVARGLFGLTDQSLVVRVAGTGLVLSLAVAALLVVRNAVARLRQRARGADERRIPQLLLALPRVAVIIAAGWFLLDVVWGVNLSAAVTALGVTSLVVSFALQDTLSGLASGLLLLSDSPFQPGDWIKSGDVEGRVVDINWRSSRILNRNGDLLIVPNAQLAGATIMNYAAPSRLHRVVVPVQVAYSNPPTLAKEMLLEAALATDGVLSDPPPKARVVQIDDPLMGYEVDLWIDDAEVAPRVASDFGSLVWYSSHRNDVPLPSPAYDLYMYDGIQAGLAGTPDRAELRRRLRIAPLLKALDEDDLDRLASGARAVRFARGEAFFQPGTIDRSLYVLWQGTARLVVRALDGREINIAELSGGDIVGLLSRVERWHHLPQVIAVTDCETVQLTEAVAGEVASRNPTLANAFNQLQATRQRRVERIVEQVRDETREPAGAEDPERSSAAETAGG